MSVLPGPDDPGRLHPASLLLAPIRQLGGWAVPLLVALFLGIRSEGGFGGFRFVLLVLGLTVAGQVVEYLRLRWWVEGGAIELRRGLLRVERRTVPLDRIQNVDIVEPIFARVLGMAELRIESAGSSAPDIVLRYVRADAAASIRSVLVGEADDPGTPSSTVKPLVHTPLSELVVAGATANRVGALAALGAAVAATLLEAGVDPEVAFDAARDLLRPGLWLVVVLVALSVAVGWVVSIVQSVLRFHDFTLVVDDDVAVRTHGLLTRASGRIPLARVQVVRVAQPWLRRRLGRATIVADTAGSIAAGVAAGTGTVSPIEREARVPELVSTMLRRPGTHARSLDPVSRLSIRRGFVRASVPALLLVAVIAWWGSWWWLTTAAAVLPLVLLWARARWAAIGYRLDDDLAVIRSGVFTRRTWFIPTDKVQAVGLRRSPFQRRLGLADVLVETAAASSGTVVVVDVEEAAARRVAEHLTQRSAAASGAPDGV